MRHHALIVAATALAGAVGAQASADWKIRPHLQDRMAAANADDQLPVYFVMRDRLGYDHFFPRVHRLSVDERRELVMRELRAHADRTQSQLFDYLCDECEAGNARGVYQNWLGNFLEVHATADVIRAAAELDQVWEVWLDCGSQAGACTDQAPAPVTGFPGNGPTAVRADEVWQLGFQGQGVLVMNADSGINANHVSLMQRLWINPGEIAGNGVDDDGNGLIDDVHGWNFFGGNADLDDNGTHGTQTAGVLVGDGSCGQTVGIAPAGTIATSAIGTETDQWAAVQYAIEIGAHVQTSSHSYKNTFDPPPNYAMHRDIGEMSLAAGLIRTNSTSNNGGSCESVFQPAIARPFNVSTPGNLPSPYRDPNQVLWGRKGGVIGVGAHQLYGNGLDSRSPCGPSAWHIDDMLSAVPNYALANWDPMDNDFPWLGGTQMGLLKPDVVAPTGTTTTSGGGVSCTLVPFGGTSNATPVAAGCIMLWKGANLSLTPEDVAMIVHQSSGDAGSVPGKENDWGAGRIDAMAGLEMALAVHRVNGEPAWEVPHLAGNDLTLEVDGSPNRPVLVAIGLERRNVDFGIVTSAIGSRLYGVFAGTTGPTGSVEVTIPVRLVDARYSVFSQVFLDDRGGPTGKILASNAIEIQVRP